MGKIMQDYGSIVDDYNPWHFHNKSKWRYQKVFDKVYKVKKVKITLELSINLLFLHNFVSTKGAKITNIAKKKECETTQEILDKEIKENNDF